MEKRTLMFVSCNIFTTHSAIQIINFFSVTEDRAFDKFYELLEEFLKEQETKQLE